MILPQSLEVNFPAAGAYLQTKGMSPESTFIWTAAKECELSFQLPTGATIGMFFTVSAFTGPDFPTQVVQIFLRDQKIGEWSCQGGWPSMKPIVIPISLLSSSGHVTLRFVLPDARAPKTLGINDDRRELAIRIMAIHWQAIADSQAFLALPFGRKVGTEARKSFDHKLRNGFWSRFVKGPAVLDVGFSGYHGEVEPILPGAVGVDVNYPGYDGTKLPFPDESQDAIFSSHCLEHIPHYIQVLQDWYRVTKVGGHIIISVPHSFLYERRKRPPSAWNGDHRRFYTPQTLLLEIEQALAPNSYRIRHLADNDWGYDYEIPLESHPGGCYEIELVIEKIKPPSWTIPL